MAVYLLRRIGFILLTLFLASMVIFAATQLLPGDVAQVMLGQFATEEAVANLIVKAGPLVVGGRRKVAGGTVAGAPYEGTAGLPVA